MASPFVGEIRMFGGNFAPAGWAFCQGQVIPISENETLFNLIGTTYGGDGQETFALPNLASRVPIHQGTGGGSTYIIGELGGVESVTLTSNTVPAHTHPLLATATTADTASPATVVPATASTYSPYIAANPNAALAAQSISAIGGSQPHENRQPYLAVNFIISLFGIFPSQN